MAQQKKKPSNPPSFNSPETALPVIMQDIDHLRKVISDQNSQITRLKRQVYNQPETTTQEEDIMAALEYNTELLEDFIRKTTPPREVDVFGKLRQERALHTRRTYLKYEDLSSMKQRKTKECPCGEHQGIEFLNAKGEVVDHLCPKHWWVMQTWLSMSKGKIKAFVESTPLDWYLSRYKKESK